MVSDAHFRHGAAHPTQTREQISHTAARSKRSEPTACPIPPVRTLGLSYPAGSCCRALPSIPFLSSAFLSSPAPSTSLLSRSQRIPPFSPLTTPTPSRAHIRRNGAEARPRLVAESFDHAVAQFAQEHLWLPPWTCCSQSTSQSASSRRMGDTTPCSCCRSSPLLFGVAFIRRSFHASPQRPARRRRPPPTPPAIRI